MPHTRWIYEVRAPMTLISCNELDVVNMNKYFRFLIGTLVTSRSFALFSLVPELLSCLRACRRKVSHPSLLLIAAYARRSGLNPVPLLFTGDPSFLDRSIWLQGQENSLTK